MKNLKGSQFPFILKFFPFVVPVTQLTKTSVFFILYNLPGMFAFSVVLPVSLHEDTVLSDKCLVSVTIRDLFIVIICLISGSTEHADSNF